MKLLLTVGAVLAEAHPPGAFIRAVKELQGVDGGFATRNVDFGGPDVPNMDILYLQETEGGGDVIAELLLDCR
ncbi:hypothetical protein Xkhy_21185 [Xanthomonas axonopodis pv. khayae]|uniref:hypothetical protein n=1 Tax=Xanthomonas axonopodis TaxID=53413 RepID=UPI0009D1C8F9|nr:hypothetical protein [Xanthomonas axonopodis]OOX04884.1 hypothetical protein Xkhy_21185 [Xanthomonas axonopodis pv. khayae]